MTVKSNNRVRPFKRITQFTQTSYSTAMNTFTKQLSIACIISLIGFPTTLFSQNYQCTQDIGFSQVGAANTGWYVAGTPVSNFEQIVGDSIWQLLWNGGGGVDLWKNPDYIGWGQNIVSPCLVNSLEPDRVLLSVSGPHGTDVTQWVADIDSTIKTIRIKYPSVQQITLQPVVGGPAHQTCYMGSDSVRASWQHKYIDSAIAIVVGMNTNVSAGCSPEVNSCSDYGDITGHFASATVAQTIGTQIGECYLSITGTDEYSLENSLFYPNPTNGAVHLNTGNQKIKSIKLFNMQGQLIQEYFTNDFSVSNFPDGFYFVTVQTDNSIYVNKLIKQT